MGNVGLSREVQARRAISKARIQERVCTERTRAAEEQVQQNLIEPL